MSGSSRDSTTAGSAGGRRVRSGRRDHAVLGDEAPPAERGAARGQSALAEISRRDALTGLHNRMHFNEVVASTLHLCARNGLTMTLAVIDLDRFKELNDSFGHPFGDACIRHVAAVLQRSFRRDTDTAIRYGGDELVVISVGGTAAETKGRLEGFRQEIEQSVVAVDSLTSRLTVSIGVWSRVPGIEDDPAGLLKQADAAVYRAKHGGRNQIVVAGDAVTPRQSNGAVQLLPP
ncbi:MAG TPA: GGDEF domain-containing protein [Thermoanaerobaculia bacterium]